MWGDKYFGTLYGEGGTFAYDERAFDRVIRLSNPVDLRNCLVDPWRNTSVTQVLFGTGQRPAGTPEVTPLNGGLVTVGNQNPTPDKPGPMFSASHNDHARPGYEVILNFHLNIGGIIDADTSTSPRVGIFATYPLWGVEFTMRKTTKFQADKVGMHLQRALFVQEHGLNGNSSHFVYYEIFNKLFIAQNSITFNMDAGIVSQLNQIPNAQWRLAMAFYRYDDDTLTGQVDGSLLGFDPSISDTGRLRPGRFWDRWPALVRETNKPDGGRRL
jgi:hypothetical protein